MSHSFDQRNFPDSVWKISNLKFHNTKKEQPTTSCPSCYYYSISFLNASISSTDNPVCFWISSIGKFILKQIMTCPFRSPSATPFSIPRCSPISIPSSRLAFISDFFDESAYIKNRNVKLDSYPLKVMINCL